MIFSTPIWKSEISQRKRHLLTLQECLQLGHLGQASECP